MTKHLLKTFVAILAIAAMAIGPARAQSNTVTWANYQMSEFNLSSQGDRLTTDDVTITSNGGSAGDNDGNIYFNGAFTFSVPAGSVFTQIVIRDDTWLGVDDNNTGWSRDEGQTEATWTGSARSVACQINASHVQYIEFTIAPAVPQMYTSEVSITDLVPGDTLAEGATIIGSGNDYDMVFLNFGRTKENGVVPQFWTDLGLPPTVIGTNGTISGTNTYTPVDENGRDGNAWVVTSADLNDDDGFQVGLGGIRIPGPPHTVRMAAGTEDAANWSIASGNVSVPGTQVLENVMSGSQVTATYNGTTKKVKSVKAVKYVVPPTLLDNTMTAWADGKYAVPAGGLTYSDAITVSGDVTLVLTDGTTLTLNKGISLASGATLTIEGNGTMNVNGTNENTTSTVAGSTGTLILTSGTLTATGGNGGSVDVVESDAHGGNGGVAINGSVIVSGGSLTARGGNGGSVDYQCIDCSGGNGGAAISGSVTVNSGTLTATGGNGGSVGDYGNNCGGGAGSAAISGDLTINSGTVTSTNGANGQLGQYTDECSAGAGGNAVAGTVTDNR